MSNEHTQQDSTVHPMPRYTVGTALNCFSASFPDGALVTFKTSRSRAYPGLPSSAPSTTPYYELLKHYAPTGHVLDIGCGCGIGIRHLLEDFARVTGVDNDPSALDFARHYAQRAEYLQSDICHGISAVGAEAAILADVLGHVKNPHSALRNVRNALISEGVLLIAEPTAYTGQRLQAPARQAFSKLALERLLAQSGFLVETWGEPLGTFIWSVARRSNAVEATALVEGRRYLERQAWGNAISAFQRARESAHSIFRNEALLGEADAHLLAGDGNAAAKTYFDLLQLAPSHPVATAGLAQIALIAGSESDAIQLALEAFRGEPTDLTAASVLASTVEQLHHPDALNTWRIAAQLAPAEPEIITGLARTAAGVNEFSVAINALEQLRGYGDPFPARLHISLSWLLFAQGRKHDALIEARLAAAMEPENAEVQELMAALEPSS